MIYRWQWLLRKQQEIIYGAIKVKTTNFTAFYCSHSIEGYIY